MSSDVKHEVFYLRLLCFVISYKQIPKEAHWGGKTKHHLERVKLQQNQVVTSLSLLFKSKVWMTEWHMAVGGDILLFTSLSFKPFCWYLLFAGVGWLCNRNDIYFLRVSIRGKLMLCNVLLKFYFYVVLISWKLSTSYCKYLHHLVKFLKDTIFKTCQVRI